MGLTLDEPDEKQQFEINGITVTMDPMTYVAAKGQVLNYGGNNQESGFSIQPKTGRC